MQQRRLLPGDVRAGTHHDLHVEIELRAVHPPAQVTGLPSLRHRHTQPVGGRRILRAHEDKPVPRPHREAGQRQALQDPVRVALHEQPVAERARIPFVAVGHHVPGCGLTSGRGPLLRHRKPGATTPAQARGGDLGHDLAG
jgi:hypothetical protein